MDKRKAMRIAMIILLIAGFLVLFYPALNNIIFVVKQNQVIDEYNEQVVDMDKSSIDQMKQEAQEYNKVLADPNYTQENENAINGNLAYSQLLNITNQQMGYVVIPKISLNQPLYHSTKDEILERGIGHLENTSLPVGGESTHCVLTGHTGVPGMMLFTDLEKMETGDKFYLKVLDEVLAYEVDQIKVVLPENQDDLKIVPGEDYVTLITCTPYGINSHRLLVRGTRVQYNGEIDDEKTVNANTSIDTNTSSTTTESSTEERTVISTQQSKFSLQFIVCYIGIPAIVVLATIITILIRKKIKKNKDKASDENE